MGSPKGPRGVEFFGRRSLPAAGVSSSSGVRGKALATSQLRMFNRLTKPLLVSILLLLI